MGSLSEDIVDAILEELHERVGFDEWWYAIKPDRQKEIKEELVDIVEEELD